MLRILRFTSLLLLAPLGAVCLAQTGSGFQVVNVMPLINRNSTANAPSAPWNLAAHDNGIQYHGGPVMNTTQAVNVYLIWYGNWSGDTLAQSIVTDFVSNVGGSPYFNINTTYYDYGAGGPDPVRNRVNYAGSITDSYSYGAALTDNDVGNIAQNAVVSGKFPLDQNGVYFVLTSADVDETSGLCTTYCAFHGFQPLTIQAPFGRSQRSPSSVNLVVGFAGATGARCPYHCSAQGPVTPNDDPTGDTMVDAVAHELSESVTDPLATGWINAPLSPKSNNYSGIENGDLCVFTYNPYFPAPNGSYYNLKLGNRLYLSQRIWVNALGGYCSMSWINGAN